MSDMFRILRPFDVSDVALVSSTVSATDALAVDGVYNPATTYALGDVIQVDSPTFAFTAAGSILTAAAHGWANDTMLQVASSGTLPPGLTASVRYFVVQADTDTLKLSRTKGGPPVITTGAGTGTHTATVSSHRLYESLVGSNTGNTPHKSPTQWLDVGATNRWKPFDISVSSQVEQVDSITYVLQTSGRTAGMALINVDATEVVITGRESGGGAIVYGPSTYSLRSSIGITSYWSWFFEPIEFKSNFVDIDFPPYSDLELTITLNGGTGDTVRCGVLIVGLPKTLGTSMTGASTGITDYSVKSQDDFGNYVVTERAFRARGNFQIVVDRTAGDGVQAELARQRATPIVYVGSSEYSSTIIYGFYRDFTVKIEQPTFSVCEIEIEGLT